MPSHYSLSTDQQPKLALFDLTGARACVCAIPSLLQFSSEWPKTAAERWHQTARDMAAGWTLISSRSASAKLTVYIDVEYFIYDVHHAGCKTYGLCRELWCTYAEEQSARSHESSTLLIRWRQILMVRYCQHHDDMSPSSDYASCGGSVHRPLNVGKCGKSTTFVYMKMPPWT
jgi:hypothetical protein